MKKLTLLSFLTMFTLFVSAQSKTDSLATKKGIEGNNEIKLNLLMSMLSLPEISYERIIAVDQSVGMAVLFGVEKLTDFNFGAIPYYRVYFGRKKANGFFIEANTAFLSIKDHEYQVMYSSFYGNYTSLTKVNTNVFGLGAAAGGKFLTKSGFVGEAYFGVGRILGKHSLETYPRFGITIGKRF